MTVGFFVLAVGGWRIVFGSTPNDVLSGGTVAAIGGALSAFITKTFLDVHKVSLMQLNRYFKQPVLNSHILTATRIAKEEIKDEAAKQKMFELVVEGVIALLTAEQQEPVDLDPKTKADSLVGNAGRVLRDPTSTKQEKEIAAIAPLGAKHK